MAISCASASPSSLHGVGGSWRFLPSRASSKRSVPRRLRRCSIVCTRQLKASAILTSGHPAPSALALSRICARRNFCDDPLTDHPLFLRQPNHILLVHGKPPCDQQFPNNSQNQQPHFLDLKGH